LWQGTIAAPTGLISKDRASVSISPCDKSYFPAFITIATILNSLVYSAFIVEN
jgi:hypothetical protein